MATKVTETLQLELQNGEVVEIKSLSIKKLRKFMEVVKELEKAENDSDNINIMIKAAAIAVEASNAELAADLDRLEDELDVPTIWKILEVAGGVKLNDPNLLMAAQVGTT